MNKFIAYMSLLLLSNTILAKTVVDIVPYAKPAMVSSTTYDLGATFPQYAQVQASVGTSPQAMTFVLHKSHGFIQLYYPFNVANRPTSGTASLKLDIVYTVLEYNKLVEKSQSTTLKVDMNPGTYAPISSIRLEHALKVTAKISDASGLPPSGFEELKLEIRTETEIFDKMALTQQVTGVGNETTFVESEGSLLVKWTAVSSAESYELEWTYVSNQNPNDVDASLTLENIKFRDQLFRTNSSRVEVTGTNYKIPLIYEKGYIVYRIRPIGHNMANNTLTLTKGTWSLGENFTSMKDVPSSHWYEYAGMEQNLNWQASVSFAEEGKNKAVVSYHDGSSRNRQAVTRINTDERSVVGETMYDYNGRPVLQMLPVPTVHNHLFYYPEFNQTEKSDGSAESIKKANYDVANQGDGCLILAPKFHTDFGASGYYSTNNPFGIAGNTKNNMLNRDLVPDAEKYPYTQTNYTPDNTGRIAAQSGVGANYVLKSGHETKYLYGTPDQEEITRLFGSQVGINGHYKKNVVIDPNKQVSVSYLDMDGKVIATALAGGNPGALSELDGDKSRHIKSELLTSVTNVLKDQTAKTYLKKMVVIENNTEYKFNYTYTAQPYLIKCKNKGTGNLDNINLAAALDVEINLEKCGENFLNYPIASVYQFGGASAVTKTMPEQTRTLNAGEYTLTKVIKVNEVKLATYLNEYISNGAYTCLIPVADYVKDSIDVVDLTGCGYDCGTCTTNVAALIVALNNKKATLGEDLLSEEEKETMLSKCDDLCRNNIHCVSALNGMLADMAIGGQYGEIRDKSLKNTSFPSIEADDFKDVTKVKENEYNTSLNNTPGESYMGTPITKLNLSKFKLSIYNPDNMLKMPSILALPFARADWHKPLRVVIPNELERTTGYNQILFKNKVNLANAAYVETDYYNTNGKLVYAKVKRISATEYFPGVIANAPVEPVNVETGEYRVRIKFLADVEIFENYWQPHFSNYLVMYHPEFMYFVECTQQEDINDFEYKLVTTTTIAGDTQHEFVSSTGTATIVDNDPLFEKYPALKKPFKLLFDNYKIAGGNTKLSMVQVANLGVSCPIASVTCPGTSCPSNTLAVGDVAAWNMFKALYISERQKLIRSIATSNAIRDQYYNGCIGDPEFYATDEASPFMTYKAYQRTSTESKRVCPNWWTFKGCYNEPVTVTVTDYSMPWFDSWQTCYIGTNRLYEDKVRKFYPKTYSFDADLQQGKCIRQILDPETNTNVNVVVSCPDDEERFIKQVTEAGIRQKYEECGLCPMASDIQDFLMLLQRKKMLKTTTAIQLNCPPATAILNMGHTLTKKFKPSSVYPAIRWSGSYNTTTRKFEGNIESSTSIPLFNTKDQVVKITLDFSTLPTGMQVDFNKLKICCLEPTGATTFKLNVYYNGFYNTTDYSVVASTEVLAPHQVANYAKAEWAITGDVTNVTLNNCTADIAPNCVATTTAKHVIGFLNMTNRTTDTEKPAQLLSTVAVDLAAGAMPKYYEFPLRTLLNINAVDANGDLEIALGDITPTWKSSIIAGKLKGELKHDDNTLNINVEKTSGTAGDAAFFTNIRYFTNIQPFVDMAGCTGTIVQCNNGKFSADAVSFDANNNKIYTQVTIEVPLYRMTICNKPVAGAK